MTALVGTATAQNINYSTWGSSHPSPETDCGEYQWPEIMSPCPEVQIKQKHDHSSRFRLDGPAPGIHPWTTNPNDKGWDTVFDCETRTTGIELSCMPYVPVQHFNGYYAVDVLDSFCPADTTFYLNYSLNGPNPGRYKVPISNDDDYNSTYTNLGFDFFFFGNTRTSFCVGDNGIVTFMPQSQTGISAANNYCPYNISPNATLPWTTTNGHTPTGEGCFNRMHEAIYGVYEDTYTGYNGAYMSGLQGIYYGVIDEEPCLKGIATWNEIPIYDNSNVRETFQMVCYQGSNIIEVHVKHRYGGTSTSSGQGFIGIQNATGEQQTRTYSGEGAYIWPSGAPAAFYPSGWNCSTAQDHYSSYRFTPQGTTQFVEKWVRVLDHYLYDTTWNETINQVFDTLANGTVVPRYDTVGTTLMPVYDTVRTFTTRQVFDTLESGQIVPLYDTIELRNINLAPEAYNDEEGYYRPQGHMSTCPTLSRAVVKPKGISRYYYHLRFCDANGRWYKLYDTIVIGVDTTADLNLHAVGRPRTEKDYKVCAGNAAQMVMEFPVTQEIDTVVYSVFRRSRGQVYELPVNESLTIGNPTESDDTIRIPITLRGNLPQTGVMRNKIDTIVVQASIEFTSHCPAYDTMIISYYPNFDTVERVGRCQGQVFTWSANGQTYDKSTQTTAQLTSEPGCDSTVHLNLTVDSVNYVVFPVTDCRPYTWDTLIGGNGQTYYESNNATAAIDTVMDTNRWGCDSITQLSFTYLPVKALLQSDREYFDFDHLEAVITDVSLNNHARTWTFPGGFTTTGPVAYYTIPAEYDEADIWLQATATYDGHTCSDTTHIVIPMRKESFWVPNIFTPESSNGNNLFGSISTRTLTEEMFIYNRNGQLVFHCEEPDCKWDGRDASGNLCPQGTYTYLIRYTNEFLPKVVHVLRGTVTLIR